MTNPTLFEEESRPLADRMRPERLDGFVGQEHLLGEKSALRRLIDRDKIPSMILWGSPGTGKTTLSRIIANITESTLEEISAVTSGVKDVRRIIESATSRRGLGKRTILFIDEIHRFNKAQQDALLHAVENGTLTLIGATTENPSFEVIGPLLSRCRVFAFKPLTPDSIGIIIDNALIQDSQLSSLSVSLVAKSRNALIEYSSGDARTALNCLEIATELAMASELKPPIELTTDLIEQALMVRAGRYDKKGEYHYDIISAFIKSMRGSDPDGAVYWLARMLDSGEDPLFIARRMVILASEDIGNANPTALVLAQSCAEAVKFIGMPEARIILSQAVCYLASSPKSNASYRAISLALDDVKKDPDRPVPLHLRNAVTGLMKAHDYGKGYRYAHSYEGHFSEQQHLPDGLEGKVYYRPTDQGNEGKIAERLKQWWAGRYDMLDEEKSD